MIKSGLHVENQQFLRKNRCFSRKNSNEICRTLQELAIFWPKIAFDQIFLAQLTTLGLLVSIYP